MHSTSNLEADGPHQSVLSAKNRKLRLQFAPHVVQWAMVDVQPANLLPGVPNNVSGECVIAS